VGGWVGGWMDINLFTYETRYSLCLYILPFAMCIKTRPSDFNFIFSTCKILYELKLRLLPTRAHFSPNTLFLKHLTALKIPVLLYHVMSALAHKE